jgi:tetratricopeptide (TPR) repeat protein
MKNLSYEESRDKVFALRDDGKFLQAIELSQLLSNELLEDLENTSDTIKRSYILKFIMNNHYIEGTLLRQVNNYYQSDIILQKSLELAQELKDNQSIAKIYSALANNQYQNGYLEQALLLLQKGFVLIKDSDYVIEKVMLQGNIGQILCILGDFDIADSLLSSMVHELEQLGEKSFFGNAYYSLAMLKYYRNLFQESLLLFERAYYEYETNKKPRNMYMTLAELIRTNIQLDNIEEAELLIEKLSKIEFEGKGEKEDLEKLILFVNIFIARKEFSIAIYSLEATIQNLDKIDLNVYKILIQFLRAVIHCLVNENDKALKLLEIINDELNSQEYIIYKSQANYVQAWAEFNENRIENAKQILEHSFTQSKGKLFNFGMFFIPESVKLFIEEQFELFSQKQQS